MTPVQSETWLLRLGDTWRITPRSWIHGKVRSIRIAHDSAFSESVTILFAPWKVAISGLYKSFTFVVVPPENGRPVMVDDTCYSLPCTCEKEARLLCDLFNAGPAQHFLWSLVFKEIPSVQSRSRSCADFLWSTLPKWGAAWMN